MSPLCQAFRLALLAQTLWPSTSLASSLIPDSMLVQSAMDDTFEPPPTDPESCKPLTGIIDITSCDYETVARAAPELYTHLSDLVSTPFFKHFQVDLFRECPFWDDNGSCSNPGCAITTLDESEVPEKWRAATLSKLEPMSEDRHDGDGCYYRDTDFCFLDDHLSGGDYYDLSTIPERFTGYSGPDAHRVWRSIYDENCFDVSEQSLVNKITMHTPDTLVSRQTIEDAESDTCLEKKVYYKIISGLHASISTHICNEYLNQSTGEWEHNLQCFITRVASYPERLQNMYFNTVLLLRAVSRLSPYLSAYDYCSTGNHEDDAETQETLKQVFTIAQDVGRFDETALFRGADAPILREEFKTHFRNVSRIMDCVGCDKCRLWGKVQTTGVATALKVLFELDEHSLDPRSNSNLLQRSEVVALINTLHRFTESLYVASSFERMFRGSKAVKTETAADDREKQPSPGPSPGVGHDIPENVLTDVWVKSAAMLRACKDSTLGCVELLRALYSKGAKSLASLFSQSKAQGPDFSEL